MDVVWVDGQSLTLAGVVAVARGRVPARLAPAARDAVARSRDQVTTLVAAGEPVYGITTGVGRLAEVVISAEESRELQHNLLASHAAGVGRPMDRDAARALVLLRANALARGHSGVRPELVEHLLELVNRDVCPVVPEQGSLGASGDLQPLAHMALVLVGAGEAWVGDRRLPGGRALAEVGLAPVSLEAKEGLALINGTQFMTAVGGLAAWDAGVVRRTADVAAALTAEAWRGIAAAYDPRLHAVRPHPGQTAVASNLRRLLEGSRSVSRPGELRVQDPYSLRCVPQVHGAVRDALAFTAVSLEREINAATDNPLLFPEAGVVLSGGNFHGQPVAVALDLLAVALAGLGNMVERRVDRLTNPELSGLPPFLVPRGGLHSGLMLAQYTAAALAAENKLLAAPASVDSIPVSANQEDHVSMGAAAARKARDAVRNLAHLVGIELLCACQALDLRYPKGLEAWLGKGTLAAYRAFRERVAFLDADRELGPDLEAAGRLVLEGRVLAAAEAAVGPLD